MSHPLTACRMCKSRNLDLYLDLGLTPLADEFRTAEQAAEPQSYFPLEVYLCTRCGLSQLGLVVSPEILYQADYPYESSITRAGHEHFRRMAATIAMEYGFGADDLAVDIGSNVGVLVRGFQDAGLRALGVDPAQNIVDIAIASGIPTICSFFDVACAEQIAGEHGPASAITATNVFAHVDDLDAFMVAIEAMLAPKGVFVIEAPHLLHLIHDLEYDTIYHEHLSYLSARPVTSFMIEHGFEVIDVQHVDIHGGSFRLFVSRKGDRQVRTSVEQVIERERAARIHDLDHLKSFAADVARHRVSLLKLLLELRSNGKRIAGVSAPAKGMTLLNYCGIGTGFLDFVTEKSRLKIGRFTPGMRLPVFPDSALHERKVDYGLLLAWNFADEIMANLGEFRASGGKFVVPIPVPTIA
jgi:C-methyltransferase-like protein/putative zinc binding protein/methyltransferase family protein